VRRGWLPRAPRALRATRPGWCFVAIIFGVGFAALNTGNNLLYLVFALMLAFLILSGILSETSLRGVSVERRVPRELYAGAPNPIVLRIRNRQKRIAAFALSVEDRLEEGDALVAAGRCFVLRVGPEACVDRSYAFVPVRRGAQAFASIRVSTRFPFGLFVKSVDLELPESVLVYPALRPVEGARVDDAGQRSAHERPGRSRTGDALASVREFARGDPAARIHWRRSLTSGRLVVGERDGHTAAELEVLLQLAPEMAPERIEERVSLAASEIVHHLAAGLRVGLRTRTTRFAADSGGAHRRELLRFLALVEVEARSPLDRNGVGTGDPMPSSPRAEEGPS
jgi:uncharacterized protein (DUF58 family)